MGEEDSSWVEVAESLQPGLVTGERLFQAFAGCLAGQLVQRELGGEVVCLAGEDHGSVALSDRE